MLLSISTLHLKLFLLDTFSVESNVRPLFPEFFYNMTTLWRKNKNMCLLCVKSTSPRLFLYLWTFLNTGSLHSVYPGCIKRVQTYVGVTPHSAGPDRAVSVHAAPKTNKQSSCFRKALNYITSRALDGIGTVLLDKTSSSKIVRGQRKKEETSRWRNW